MSSVTTIIRQTKYGMMQYYHNDSVFARSLSNGHIHEESVIEQLLEDIIKRSSVIIDIGAHCGSHSLIYAKMNPESKIYAYEPQKKMFDLLNSNLRNNDITNVTTFNVALGNKRCHASMDDRVLDGENAGKQINDIDQFNLGGLQIGIGGEPITIERLDDSHYERIDYIKIDVEGFESFVVDGGINTIKRCRPTIFFEKNNKKPTTNMDGFYNPISNDIFEVLLSLSYEITKVDNDNYLAIPSDLSLKKIE